MQAAQKKFLHDLAAELLGIAGNKVVWVNQNMPRIQKPYATLHLYSQQAEVQEDLRKTGKPGIVNVLVPTTAKLEVQLFGMNGENTAGELETLIRKLELPSVVDQCFAARVAFYDAGPVQDITALLDGQTFEPRASVDLSIRYNSMITDDVGYIEEVDIKEVDISGIVGDDKEHMIKIKVGEE